MHKRLAAAAATQADRLVSLKKSMDTKYSSMEMDLNPSSCSSNPPPYLPAKKPQGRPGAGHPKSPEAVIACERAKKA